MPGALTVIGRMLFTVQSIIAFSVFLFASQQEEFVWAGWVTSGCVSMPSEVLLSSADAMIFQGSGPVGCHWHPSACDIQAIFAPVCAHLSRRVFAADSQQEASVVDSRPAQVLLPIQRDPAVRPLPRRPPDALVRDHWLDLHHSIRQGPRRRGA